MNYSCIKCAHAFSSKDSLQKHMNRKTPCMVIDTNTTTNNKFKCDSCNRLFSSNQGLKKHIASRCPIIKNKEKKKIDSDNMQCQIDELKEMVNILKNTVDELKTMVMNTVSKKTETIYVPKLIGDKDIITGIIYLIQPEELLQTNRYKIGCSAKNDLSRVNSYKKNSRYLYIAECINPYTLEANIKSIFNNKYTLIAGREYFEGDEKDIVNNFVKIVNDYNNEVFS